MRGRGVRGRGSLQLGRGEVGEGEEGGGGEAQTELSEPSPSPPGFVKQLIFCYHGRRQNAECRKCVTYLELLISSKLGHKFVVGQIQCEPAIFFNGFKLIARSVANLGESPRSI